MNRELGKKSLQARERSLIQAIARATDELRAVQTALLKLHVEETDLDRQRRECFGGLR